MSKARLRAHLAAGLPPVQARCRAGLLDAVVDELGTELCERFDPADPEPITFFEVFRGILEEAVSTAADIDARQRQFESFTAKYAAVDEPDLRRRLLEARLRETVPDRRRLRADRRALNRHLDVDALTERHLRRQARAERDIGIRLRLLAALSARLSGPRARFCALAVLVRAHLWQALEVLLADRPAAVRADALQLLCELLEQGRDSNLPAAAIDLLLRANTLARERRVARVLQVAALRLLLLTGAEDAEAVLRYRLVIHRSAPSRKEVDKDDFLVRAAAVRLLLRYLPPDEATTILQESRRAGEPSEWVRMCWARAAAPQLDHVPLRRFFLDLTAGGTFPDPSERVRAEVVRVLGAHFRWILRSGGSGAAAAADLIDACAGDEAALVQECFLVELEQLADLEADKRSRVVSLTHAPLLALARGEGAGPRIARRAAVLLERLVLLEDEQAASALRELERKLASTPVAGTLRWTPPPGLPVRPERLPVQAGINDFGVQARRERRSWTLMRGERLRRRFWRILNELLHPAPTKRQGYPHTTGNLPFGELRCPPELMAGITETTVPGEPIVSSALEGWAPHLPQVSDLLHAVERNETVRIEHPHGLTVLEPPAGGGRLRALRELNLRFARYDALRRRSIESEDAQERRGYMTAVQAMGFQVHYSPLELPTVSGLLQLRYPALDDHAAAPVPTIAFAMLPPSAIEWTRLGREAWSYMLDPSANTAAHLTAVTGTFLAMMLAGGWLETRRIRRLRASIPLTLGGWGTRGKSGTERLKAGLLHGLGLEVVSKTTGCEAMFIHSGPGLEPREIFLYRPYDKASIWEQRDVLSQASALGAEVMLWECMALNTRYVQILQLDWMRDDIVTLTNCYPDHEDVQGPGSRDVAASISTFVPRDGTLISSEREMLPLIREQARLRNSEFETVTDLDAALIPQDLLDRFPYREHPKNIALVAALAARLGVGFEEAIIAMADHVVADLGSLKVFPTAHLDGRRLRFINGHSANERTGFRNNWRATKLDDFDDDAAPGEWVFTVVNNRADRIPRSQVFARILVFDIRTHGHLVIGTNLSGFNSYVSEALGEFLANLTLGDTPETRERRFRELFSRLFLGKWGPETVATRAAVWLQGLSVDAAAVDTARADLERELSRLFSAPGETGAPLPELRRSLVADPGLRDAIDALAEHIPDRQLHSAFRDFLMRECALRRAVQLLHRQVREGLGDEPVRRRYRELFLERVHYVEDSGATGDQVILQLVRHIPPGALAHVLGCQNIKGTGLDFIYRWIAWEKVHGLLFRAGSSDLADAREALSELELFSDSGIVDSEGAIAALSALREQGRAPPETDRAIAALRERRDAQRKKAAVGSKSRDTRARATIIRFLERMFDYLHSIRRRRTSERILRDLAAERISHDRAVRLMRFLVSTQKGGWLSRRPPT